MSKSTSPEPGNEWLRRIRTNSRRIAISICEISGAEVFAAFHRRFRAGDLSSDDLDRARNLFLKDFEQLYSRLPISKAIVDVGMKLIQKHPLHGYDSIQLGATIFFLNELQKLNGEFLIFVSADEVLNDAARSEGLTVINPSDQA